jgi:hypothetical protein
VAHSRPLATSVPGTRRGPAEPRKQRLRWRRRAAHMADVCAAFSDCETTQRRPLQTRQGPREPRAMHQLRPLRPQGQGHQEVCDPQHRRGRRRQRHQRGQLLSL